MKHDNAVRDESGLTLVELLVTIVIMSVAFIAILSAIATYHKATVVQRSSSDLDAVSRSYAEQLGDAAYDDCATASSYSSVTAPSGFSVAKSVTYWNGNASGANFVVTCPSTDKGAQQLTLTFTKSSTGQQSIFTIVKRKP